MSGKGPEIPAADENVPPEFGLYHSDTRNLKETLTEQFGVEEAEENLLDVTITSPPYADAKDYGYDEEMQVGLGDDYEDFLEELRDIYGQTYDLTKSDGSLWVIVNTLKKNRRTVRIPTDIADVCENLEDKTHCDECGTHLEKDRESGEFFCPDEECGFTYDALEDSWRLQDIVIWDKVRALPYSGVGKFRNVFEYILCFSKEEDFHFNLDNIRVADPKEFKDWWINYPERYNPRGKVPDNIWEMVTPTQGGWGNMNIDHPAPFPRELVERIVNLTTDEGDTVFDPFSGTGTVLAQSEAMKRKALGFELSDDYVEAFPKLREEIFEEWEERKANHETLRSNQAEMAVTVWKLRQLIFPRKLFQSLPDEFGDRDMDEMGINTVFLHSKDDESTFRDLETSRVDVACTVVVDDGLSETEIEELTELLQEAREIEPGSDVPVNVDLSVESVSKFLESTAEMYEEEQLYLYNKNSFNYPHGKITLDEWREGVSSPTLWRDNHVSYNYPPVVSELCVNVDEDGDPVVEDLEDVSVETGGPQLTDF